MKKQVLFILLTVLLVVIVTACQSGGSTPSEGTTEAPLVVFFSEGVSDYTVVFPEAYDEDSTGASAVNELKSLVETNAGAPFAFSSDYTADSAPSTALEILLGETNRPETAQAKVGLREKDYVIKVIGNRLVVVGGSEEASADAIRRFGAMFFSQTQSALILREDYEYAYQYDYPLSSLTLGDSPLYEYTVVYEQGYVDDAQKLQSELQALTGYRLSVCREGSDAAAAVTDKRICLSGADEDTCSVTYNQNTLTLSGNNSAHMALAVTRFLNALKQDEDKRVVIDTGFTVDSSLSSGVSLSVFDLNLYSTGYAENAVVNRYPRLMKLLETYKPSILALQDVSPTWLKCMKGELSEGALLLDTYDYVGKGRNNDDDSVMQAIFYDKTLFTLKDSGTFWLSDTPEWESVGWDGRTRCICTWAVLVHKESGKEFAVMNTQLDPYGMLAKKNGAALILERAESFGLPVILCGDMQSVSSNPGVKTFTNASFCNSQSLAKMVLEKGKTVNGAFGNDATNFTSASDFILLSYGDFLVDSYTLIKDLVDEAYVSNHWPVFCHILLQ